MTRILVTGGAGYIGSHTAKALAGAGFEPVVLDNLSVGHRLAVRWGPLIEGDLADIDLLGRVMRSYQPEAIVHFAAHAYVGESVAQPRKYFRNNVVNTLNLLEAALDAGIGAVVFSSTCATYGLPEQLPIAEDQPQRPINPYGESKLFVEKMLRRFGDAYGLSWFALRYFNAAGADPDGEIGEQHTPETHLIPLALQAATGARPALEIFGTDYPTPDGTAIRDYIHVSDLAEAHVGALCYLLSGGASTAANLGTGAGYSVRQVIEAVERIAWRTVPVREGPRRTGDPAALVADPARAAAVLGWAPRHSGLDEIVATAWRWHNRESGFLPG
jgi:UDP-arabinose 4-epimerase